MKTITTHDRKVLLRDIGHQNIIFDLKGVLLIQDNPYDLIAKTMQNHPLEPSFKPVNLALSISLLKNCKDAGHRLFVLSNLSWTKYNQIQENPEIQSLLSYFDDIILSDMIGYRKPNPEIFTYLCQKHNLDPADCIFIDDQLENLKGAHAAYINKTILCQNFDLKKVRIRLIEFGVLPNSCIQTINLPTGHA
jgi:FMN phosphatase YigB (HAD superfamily)